jgi:hypothetical protein
MESTIRKKDFTHCFPIPEEIGHDFVHRGLCALVSKDKKYHWKIEELLVLEAIQAELRSVDPSDSSCEI